MADDHIKDRSAIVDYWANRWATSQTRWHKQDIHPTLIQHYDQLTQGQEDLTFLFPLCGKTKDMLWTYSKGHKVVGVEAVSFAAQQFVDESGLEFAKERITLNGEEIEIFASKDQRLRIFICDLFKVTPELIGGPVDCVFDRGSYVAIEKNDRKLYIELMYSLYTNKTRHLMETTEYDETRHDGPPRHVDRKEIPAFFKEIGEKVGYHQNYQCLRL